MPHKDVRGVAYSYYMYITILSKSQSKKKPSKRRPFFHRFAKFKIYSSRLFNEMNTFVYINGRPDHQKGHHDDLIMGMAMATYVAEASFSNLTKVTEHTKAMIDSWSVNNNTDMNKTLDFNPVIPNYSDRQGQFNGGHIAKEDYNKYGWLFGGMR